MGDLEGEEEERAFESLKRRRFDLNFKFPNGDSYDDVLKRTKKFLEKSLEFQNKKVLIVTHAGTMRALLSILTKQNYEKNPALVDTIDCPNGLIYIFDTERNELRWRNINSDKIGWGILRRESY
jgi:broad specificity phosphatase PhoE